MILNNLELYDYIDPVIENLPKLVELERQHGKTLDSMEAFVSSVKLLYDNSIVTRKVKALATHLLSPLRPTPVVPSNNHTWAIKNCMLMAQQLMLVATAYGLSTGPMEGFDERRVSYILGIPLQRYAIPLIINIGYSIESTDSRGDSNDEGSSDYYRIAENVPKKLRFPVEDICYLNKYGIKLK